MRTEKHIARAWGMAHEIFSDAHCQVKRCEISSGYGCSKHVHHHKSNAFAVQIGKVIIETPEMPWLLLPGDQIVVPAGQLHRFVALTDVSLFEIYYGDVDENDIERMTESGKLTQEEIGLLSGRCEAV